MSAATPDPHPDRITPHRFQKEALEALALTRAEGRRAGLVVLATGLGKTWLAAFDSRPFARILFVAHREEILAQARASFQRLRPKDSSGLYNAEAKDPDADLLFASIQTLGRSRHLQSFDPETFDYIIVDEFHHASAPTYRRLIDHFRPRFLLGLTATPDRLDGGDLLSLCQDNLVYRRSFWEGIEAGLLAPFHYYGVPDDLDYAQIPWRGRSFDETKLTAALATRIRAENALENYRRHRQRRALGFCCSVRHAAFMARIFQEHGIRAEAVHSGPDSAPRDKALQDLKSGALEILFTVDMFNEGVDVPEIDTVLMLRPTESETIWTQQFGRGLCKAAGKERLVVIDYIGNHQVFLTKLRALLQPGEGVRALRTAFEQAERGERPLPPGCSVTYDLTLIPLLQGLIGSTETGDLLADWYAQAWEGQGIRPTALQAFEAGYDPRRSGHGSWLSFLRDQQDLTQKEQGLLESLGGLFARIHAADGLTGPALGLLHLLAEPGFRGRCPVTEAAIRLEMAEAALGTLAGTPALAGPAAEPWLEVEAETLQILPRLAAPLRPVACGLIRELSAWRLAESATVIPPTLARAPSQLAEGGPELWRSYQREEIPALFGMIYKKGLWGFQGMIPVPQGVVLLITLQKKGSAEKHDYQDFFVDGQTLHWLSQNQTGLDSSQGKIIRGLISGKAVHAFVRYRKTLPRGATAPFVYCGALETLRHEGETPITVISRLPQPLPESIWTQFRRVRHAPPDPAP